MTAIYRFLPWVRQGISAAIAEVDTLVAGQPDRAHLPIGLHVDGEAQVHPEVALYGPGDVIGIAEHQIVRTDPAANSVGAETTRFPAVELRSPTLPWLYTPAGADRLGRLRPWLCLVVVPAVGAAAPVPHVNGRPPSVMLPIDELPDLAQSWAWAHAQVIADDAGTSIVELVAEQPGRAVSRLVCPRRLLPHTQYRAFVVPVFEAGRRAGLGLAGDEAGTAPAWSASTDKSVTLPVYHHWTFATGAGGDFASLASKLSHQPAPVGVGVLDLDMGELVQGAVLPFAGVLRAPDGADHNAEERAVLAAARTALRTALERTQDDRNEKGPVVGPPLYGRWQAAVPALPPAGEHPPWLGELNLDPRHRAAAALGALVVRDQQNQLMAAAWAQVGDVEEASQVLCQAQLAREAGRRAHQQLAAMPAGTVLGVTHGVQHRMMWTDGTAGARLRSTRLPSAVTSPTLRRLARPRGPFARGAVAGGPRLASIAATVLLQGELDALPMLANPAGLDLPGNVLSPSATPPKVHQQGAGLVADGFEKALADSAGRLQESLDLVESRPRSIGAAEIAQGLLSRLDPDETVPARIRDRISERQSPRDDAADPLEPVLAAPTFTQPMYGPLRDLGLETFAPGLGRLPADSVTLLETNPVFVEAFMVGLNHEMGRELLWRGYPTDQHGTYFRNFWGGSWPAVGRAREIHRWEQGLGANHPETAGAEGLLVLALRGELLRRHPDAAVYAAEAVGEGAGHVPGNRELTPRFEGRADPDITFAGFDLTVQEAASSDDHAGWFFVIEQPAGEPGFGLHPSVEPVAPEDLPGWHELTWGHLRPDSSAPPATYAPVGGPLEGMRRDDLEWGLNSAHLAGITLRRPVRVAIHADRLLPPTKELR